jgi:NhaP-type Na+/H+ or K+/H+ antiporter
MGMSVFTGLFKDYDIIFSALALTFCFFGRFMNIFRQKGTNHISIKLQTVLWFAGLRGAIAFALAMNMPGYDIICVSPRVVLYAKAQGSSTFIVLILTLHVCHLASSLGRTVMCMQLRLFPSVYLPRSFVED